MAIKGGDLSKLDSEQATTVLLENLQTIKQVLSVLKEEHNLDINQILSSEKVEESIPISAFSIDRLSALEIIVKYLKENRGLTYHQIAEKINRDDRTIWATYSNSRKKFRGKIKEQPSLLNIPLNVISDRNFSVLESIVHYLKEEKKLSYEKISTLLRKNYQTIYTTYRRSVIKTRSITSNKVVRGVVSR